MSRSQLFIQIHTHYLEKATKLLDDEFEEGSEEDRMDIAQREFNDNPYQFQNLYNNIDELFLHDDGRHIAPFQVIRVLDDLTDYIKYTLDIDSVDLNKLEATFALALAFEWAREEPIVKLTSAELYPQQVVVKANCDNGTCNGGRAWTTDESCERDSSKMFCCGECADEWVSKKAYKAKTAIHMKGVPQATINTYCKVNNITRAELHQKLENGETVKFTMN
jgi:hypothetical protein